MVPFSPSFETFLAFPFPFPLPFPLPLPEEERGSSTPSISSVVTSYSSVKSTGRLRVLRRDASARSPRLNRSEEEEEREGEFYDGIHARVRGREKRTNVRV